MDRMSQISQLAVTSPGKIVLLVMDGLGGLPHPETGKTELETAKTPHLDRLAKEGICGMSEPLGPGLTPGSGPGHLGLFGYDPFAFVIGRGILEALGIDFPLEKGDIAARGNFCTVDNKGVITDRRAGRISTEVCTKLCEELGGINFPGVKALVAPVEGHRFLLVLRGASLKTDLADSDPQQVGVAPKEVAALNREAEATAAVVNSWIAKARGVLADHHPANMVVLRGFARLPHLPSMGESYKLNPVAIATYPMYRGLARLVGMKVVDCGRSVEDQFAALAKHYAEYDFLFLHIKKTDTAGEDGDFPRKVKAIEEVDAAIPRVVDLKPDVIVVTGDHSTPAVMKAHSWHPVPFLLHSPLCRPDDVIEFSERACSKGALGRFPALDIMPLALAHAQKLAKFGA
jgi:2,3-bisphosphoglycerate-independent phosphoglycerate mutase